MSSSPMHTAGGGDPAVALLKRAAEAIRAVRDASSPTHLAAIQELLSDLDAHLSQIERTVNENASSASSSTSTIAAYPSPAPATPPNAAPISLPPSTPESPSGPSVLRRHGTLAALPSPAIRRPAPTSPSPPTSSRRQPSSSNGHHTQPLRRQGAVKSISPSPTTTPARYRPYGAPPRATYHYRSATGARHARTTGGPFVVASETPVFSFGVPLPPRGGSESGDTDIVEDPARASSPGLVSGALRAFRGFLGWPSPPSSPPGAGARFAGRGVEEASRAEEEMKVMVGLASEGSSSSSMETVTEVGASSGHEGGTGGPAVPLPARVVRRSERLAASQAASPGSTATPPRSAMRGKKRSRDEAEEEGERQKEEGKGEGGERKAKKVKFRESIEVWTISREGSLVNVGSGASGAGASDMGGGASGSGSGGGAVTGASEGEGASGSAGGGVGVCFSVADFDSPDM